MTRGNLSVLTQDLAARGITRRYVDVNGSQTSYLEKGEGPTVLLIHGGDFSSLNSGADWTMQIESLGERFRVIALDRIGQGFTANPAGHYRFDMTSSCAHVADFVQVLKLEQFAVVGHSRGGMPAVRLALSAPDRTTALALFDSNTLSPPGDGTTQEFYRMARTEVSGETDLDYVRREPALNSYSADHLTPDFLRTRVAVRRLPKTAEAHAVMADPHRRAVFIADVDRLREDTLRAIDAGELRPDVLVAWGRDDPSAPLSRGFELYERLASASRGSRVQLHVFNKAGHYSFREQATDNNAVLHHFNERHRQTASASPAPSTTGDER